jgi:hypothetical protein
MMENFLLNSISQSHIFVGPFVTFTYISVHIHITSVNPKGGQNDIGYKTYIMFYIVETRILCLLDKHCWTLLVVHKTQ